MRWGGGSGRPKKYIPLLKGFDEKRRDVRAEKKKKIHELTDPNHAWESEFAAPEPEPEPVAVEVFSQPGINIFIF